MTNQTSSPPPSPLPPALFRIDRAGTWYYRDSVIARPAMVRLFASILRRVGDEYYLVTPVERERVIVEDAPFLAVELAIQGAGQGQILQFTTNIGREIIASRTHPIIIKEGANQTIKPYISLGDELMALIARSVYFELANLAVERVWDGKTQYGVWSQGVFFPLG